MYAIIRAGGKQAKVQSGDVIDIERVKGDANELSFAPLLVVDDKGTAVSDRSILAGASVTARVVGETQGPKIDIYKYKNKTGYSRRQGHRQKYTRIEITGISLPGAKAKPAKTASAKDAEQPVEEAVPAEATTAKETTAKTSATKTAAAKTSATKAAAPKEAGAAAKPKTAAKPKAPAKPKSSPSPEEG